MPYPLECGMVGVDFFRSFVSNKVSLFRMYNILPMILVLVASIYDTVLFKSSMGLNYEFFGK